MTIAPKGNLEKVFGDVLRTLRMERGMSQEALAFEAQLDRTFISLLERGQRLPSLATLFALAEALGISGKDMVAYVEKRLGHGPP